MVNPARSRDTGAVSAVSGPMRTRVVLPLLVVASAAAVVRDLGGRTVVVGYAMEDAGNGGSWPVAHLVWTLAS